MKRCVSNRERCKLARRSVSITTSLDELFQRPDVAEFFVKEVVVAAHVSDGVTRPRAHVRVVMIQQIRDALDNVCFVDQGVVFLLHARQLHDDDEPVDDDLRVAAFAIENL